MGCRISVPRGTNLRNFRRDTSQRTSTSTVHDEPIPLALRLLEGLLEDKDKRNSLTDLRGNQAKTMVDFLDHILTCSLVPESSPTRKHVLSTLARLVQFTLVFPEPLKLKGLDAKFERNISSSRNYNLYKAHFKERAVSIKVIPPSEGDSNRKEIHHAYAKEVILRAYIAHPNILPLSGIHVGERFDGVYIPEIRIVSPWMDNGGLLGYCQKHPERSLEMMFDIISGLVHLHDHKLVHGDLRAANVLVSGAGRAVLSNFEVSPIAPRGSQVSIQSVVMGGSWWSAPEVLHKTTGRTPKSDIWSFACTCFEIMTGQPPYRQQGMPFERFFDLSQQNKLAAPKQPRNLGEEEKHIWKDLLVQCWNDFPNSRPESSKVLKYFSKWMSTDNASRQDELTKPWEVVRSESNFEAESCDYVLSILRDIKGGKH